MRSSGVQLMDFMLDAAGGKLACNECLRVYGVDRSVSVGFSLFLMLFKFSQTLFCINLPFLKKVTSSIHTRISKHISSSVSLKHNTFLYDIFTNIHIFLCSFPNAHILHMCFGWRTASQNVEKCKFIRTASFGSGIELQSAN